MNLDTITSLLDGARIALCVIVVVGFLHLQRLTRDRLYSAFAVAFGLLAVNWLLLGLQLGRGDGNALVFLPRLLAFLVIIAAIVDKNRRAATDRAVAATDGVTRAAKHGQPH